MHKLDLVSLQKAQLADLQTQIRELDNALTWGTDSQLDQLLDAYGTAVRHPDDYESVVEALIMDLEDECAELLKRIGGTNENLSL